ncbi:autotransporter-associated beta strand repeat-containing protein [Chitinimonas sp. PSY-7]|uniref:autotransporter-associated beta strand repeat-containing protein n=1 Tax=Chitinimonas sp. PSY-7 TaxID=3459088 RepID=UPI0040401AA4
MARRNPSPVCGIVAAQRHRPAAVRHALRRSVAAILLAFPLQSFAINVANESDWATAMAAVSAAGAGSTITIDFTSNFTLTSSLTALQANAANVTVNINGGGMTVNGASTYQGISIQGNQTPTVNISSLTISNTRAQGGTGQAGYAGYYTVPLAYGSGAGGGGGTGAGGGLFVGGGANVTLTGVSFSSNSAIGGTGGAGGSAQNTSADMVTGGNGGAGGVLNGGATIGGGGAGGTGGHSGNATVGTAGSALGSGGGGGGGKEPAGNGDYSAPSLSGGAGSGGGGSGGTGGQGATQHGVNSPGADGGNGGNGGNGNGGAIFADAGGSLTIIDTAISGATATGGTAGAGGTGAGSSAFPGTVGSNGSASGASIYLNGLRLGVSVTSGTVTYGNEISGNGQVISGVTEALNKMGSGTLALSATNNFVGGIAINGGTLSVGAAANLGYAYNNVTIGTGTTLAVTNTTTLENTRYIYLNGSATMDIATGTTTTVLGYVGNGTPAGSLNKTGAGTLVLSYANGYTGTTTISAGTVRLGAVGGIADSNDVAISAGATLDLNNFSKTLGAVSGAGNVVLGSGTLTAGTSGSQTLSGVISGTGGLTKANSGTLTLTGANTYTGATTISAGTLQIGSGGTTGSVAGNITNNATLAFNRSDNISYTGVVSGSGALIKQGAGTLTLSGANTYTGGTTISASTLQIGNGGTTGSIAGNVTNNAALTFNRSDNISYAGNISGTGALTKQGAGVLTFSGTNTHSGGTTISAGTLQIGSGGTTGSLTGNITNNAALTFNRSDNLSYTGNISGTGVLTQQGAGILTLSGTNTHSGGTTISAGTLQIGSGGTTGSVAGNITNNAALTFNRSDNISFANVISGSGAVTKQGAGVLTLSDANTYTGGTTISAGTLQIGSGGTTGSLVGDITNNAALVFNRSDNISYTGVVSGSGALTKQGNGTLTLTGANTSTGGTTINAGTLQVGSGGTIGSLAGDVTNNGTLAFNRSDDSSFAGAISGTGALIKQGSGVLTLASTISHTGGTTISAGTLQIGNGGTTGSLASNITNNAALAFNRSDDISYTNTISGSGALVKQGAGTLTLSSTQSYTGGTTISAGTLQIGNGGTSGNIVGNVTDNGTLAFNRSDDINFTGNISGTGALTKQGAGVLTLSGTNTYTGDTTISAGSLQVGNGGTTGSLAGNVINNTALTFNRSDDLGYTGNISGAGALTKLGAGVLTLSGMNTHVGGTTVSAGTLQIGSGGNSGSLVGDVTNNGVLAFNRSDDISFSNIISGSGALLKQGNGILTLSNANTYTGGTTISAGTLQIGSGGISGSLVGSVVNNAALAFNRSDDISFTDTISGTGVLVKQGSGILTLANTAGHTGGTTISAGTLQVGNGSTTGSLAGDVTNNASLVFHRADGSNFMGAVRGSGSLIKQGAGVLTLTGAASHTGGTTISAGTLQVGGGGNSGSLAGDITNNATLLFNRSDDINVAGTISGSGAVTKQGTGVLILTGTNAHTGGTTVSTGTLQLGNGGTSGNVTGDITNNAILAFNRSDDINFAGAVTGSGTLVKHGAGTLTLTGNTSHTGGTIISAGTLQIGNGGNLAGDIINNATLAFNRTDDLEFAGSVSGTGTIGKTGAGKLTLTGDNSGFSGATTIDAGSVLLTGRLAGSVTLQRNGTLQIGNGGASGDLAGAIRNDGTLIFARSDDYDYTGALSGDGELRQEGAGLVRLTGTYTYTGATIVKSGRLILAADLNPVTTLVLTSGNFDLGGRSQTVAGLSGPAGTLNLNNGTLTLLQTTDSEFGGVLAGDSTSRLIKSGTGTLNLTGTSNFTGGTTVNGGLLAVNGSLPSAVMVDTGGTVGGNGTLGGLTVNNGGITAPGNSIGVLKVSNDINFTPGSIYEVEVDAAGHNDLLQGTGKMTITGGTVRVLAANGDYKASTTYTIATVTGTVNGKFDQVTSNLAFLNPALAYDATNVYLQLNRNSVAFSTVAQTPNQRGTADGLQSLGAGNSLYDAVVAMDETNARAAFDATSGEIHTASNLAGREDARISREAALSRLYGATDSESGAWAQLVHNWGKHKDDGNAAKLDRKQKGVVVGLDTVTAGNWRIGLAGAFTDTDLDIDARSSNGTLKNKQLLLYAGSRSKTLQLRGGLGWNQGEMDSTRRVQVGAISNTLTANYDVKGRQAFAEIAYRVPIGSATEIEPVAMLASVRVKQAALTESGGAAALTGSAHATTSTLSVLGLRSKLNLHDQSYLAAQLGWQHYYHATPPTTQLSFASAPGTLPFETAGPRTGRNALLTDIAYDKRLSSTFSISARYRGLSSRSNSDHAIKIGALKTF